MATSGVYNYNVTGEDIITEALGLIGVYSVGEAIEATESADALRTLNFMIKALQNRNMGLWLYKDLSLFLQYETASYDIGLTGDNCSASSIKTEVATAAASGASAVIVDSVTGFGDTFDRDGISAASTPTGAGSLTLGGALATDGIAVLSGQRKILIYSDADESGDTFTVTGTNGNGVAVTENITGPNTTTVYSTYEYKKITSVTTDGAGTGNIEVGQVGDPVGIELDDKTIQWTNIGAALSTTLTLITTLTDDVAVDNHVYSYTTLSPRPLEILEAKLHDPNGYDRPLTISSKTDYERLSYKTSSGLPNQIYYDKQLNNGKLYTWPVCNDAQYYIKMSARLPIQIFDSLTDDCEFGAEWYEALSWNLAIRLAPKYGKPIDAMMRNIAESFMTEAFAFDTEQEPTRINIVSRRY